MDRASFERSAAELWNATAAADGPGLLLRGLEGQPVRRDELDPLIASSLVRLTRLAAHVADRLRHHPDLHVRRTAALLAARGHPLLAALDD